ncbi:MAG TPA: septum formation family protein [Rhodoglobus sp.]|nr:septum formation family protein [Rhodoglobus sp.]
MTDDRTPDDELDPSDWLASQFGAPEPEVAPPADARPPVTPPTPVAPPAVAPPTPAAPPAAPAPAVPPFAAPAPAVPPFAAPVVPPPSSGAPFQWGLSPSGTSDPTAAVPQQPEPPAQLLPPAQPLAPSAPPAQPQPTVDPFATQAFPQLPPQPPTQPYVPPAAPPIQPPAADAPPTLPPTQAFTAPFDPGATQAMPVQGQELEPQAPDPMRWMAAPVDPALDGMTEVIEAEIVGLATPEGEGVEASAIDSLFGETQFKEYADEIIPAPPPRANAAGGGGGATKPPAGPRGALPRNQKILLSVAGGLLAVLALFALFLVGTKLSAVLGPAPAVSTPSPSPSPSFIVLPIGPVAPGDYQWDELLGGECLKPFESAWQDRYTVVDCTVPHPAQMIYRGEFADEATAPYPGVEELQKRINLLCTAPTVIDYSKAGAATDIQVQASFAADAEDWDTGNRTFYCFVNRSGGEDLTQSIAIPQVAPTPTPLPAG